jgi:two-component system cell cycle sensor histidine kinase/response regulator CckA
MDGLADVAEIPFRSMVEGMLEGVAFLDREWRFRYLNESAARNLGAPRDALIGTSIFDHDVGRDSSPTHVRFARCAETGKPDRFEASITAQDGSLRWFEFSVKPCDDGVLVLSLDVTARHHAADVDARLRAALESIDLVAVILDPAGRIVFANEALARALGWTREQLLGCDWFERFASADDRASLRASFEDVVRSGEAPGQHEHTLVTSDGRRRTIVWSSTIIKDTDGAVAAVASVGDDVTDRRAFEAAFRETSALVDAALDASDDSISVYRPVFDEAGRFVDAEVVYANACAMRRWLADVTPDAVYGRRAFQLNPAARDWIFDVFRSVAEERRQVHVVREVPVPGGHRTIDITVTPYEGGFVHVGRDVTELQRTSGELREREAELRRTLSSVDAIISSSPREGGPLTVSPQIERILGWKPEDVATSAAWIALIHPDDVPACEAAWRANPDAWSVRYRIRRRDGSYATVADRGRRFRDEVDQNGSFSVIVDVSERVAAEAALAESEQRLREIVEGVDAIVAFRERESTRLELSPQVERILGWRPEEIPNFAAWHALVHPDDLPGCLEVWDRNLATWELEYRMRRADGTWAWVVDHGRVTPPSDGSSTFTFGIVVDATRRHESEDALRRSEERQRRTIDGLDAIVAIQEHAGAPIISSSQLQQILGIDPATVTTFDDWRALVHPDDLPRCLALWKDRPPTWELEYRMRHADGHDVWVLDRGRRIAREDGLGEGTFGIVVDVTDRHAAAEALHASEEQLRRILQGVDAIISYQEAAGDPVVISPQTERILGYPPERLAPFERWRALIHPDDLPMCQRVWGRSGSTWEMDYRMRRADGAWIWVNDHGVRITHEDGRGAGLFGVVTDVTVQHQAADRLRASEARFRAMFEENPEAIGVLRPILGSDGTCRDAEFLAANRTTRERWLGGVPMELVAGTRSSALWFTAGEEVWAAIAHVAEEGTAWRDEVRTTRNGLEAWSDLSVFPFEAGVAFVGRDITEQKRSELAVRDSEARFRAVTASAADAIVTVDASGIVAGWNPSAEQMFGYEPGGLADHPLTALMPEVDVREWLAQAGLPGDAAAGSIAERLRQLEGRRADGTSLPIELSLASWTLEGRRYATAIIRDITERRNAEEAARSAAAFERSVMDSMAEGLLIIGLDGGVTAANARAATVLGYEAAELTGQAVGAAWEPQDEDGGTHPGEGGPVMTALRSGTASRDVEISVARPDGARRWLRVNAEPLRDRNGAVIAAVVTFTDVTVEREMSEQLRRSQRMEAVGQLAGGVAHDFNNLLAAIKGYAELALAALEPSSPARHDVEEALRASDRAAVLTRQLLQFSRREVLAPRRLDPADVVDGLIPMLRQLVGEHIELIAHRADRTGVVMADPGQLEQVILNLVVNARDAMPSGGRIEVATCMVAPDSAVSIGSPPAWPAVRITVADSGHGIDPADLPHIFEPFFTTKEAGRGSGMGLATVYGIVGASGGTVAVSTSPGRGTTFTVDLPAIDATAEENPVGPTGSEAPAAGDDTDVGRGTVLLVEDDVAVRAILARMLANLGWQVEEQPSGTAAAEEVASGHVAQPAILVTDVRMPGLQGPDLARRLRMTWPHLPVLFITGLADEVGADEPWVHVLTKPFNAAQLVTAIEAAVEDGG